MQALVKFFIPNPALAEIQPFPNLAKIQLWPNFHQITDRGQILKMLES